MGRRTTTITSKWIVGGDGTLKDAFPLPPMLKLAFDAFVYLLRHPLYILLPTVFIVLLINADTKRAILGTFLLAVVIALLLVGARKQSLKRNTHHVTKLNKTAPTVPLDPKNKNAIITLDRSILIGGESGSGKSNMVWKILKGLNDFGIPYRLHVIDPAGGVELADLQSSPYTVNYTDRAKRADKIIQLVRNDMDARLARMRETNTRKLLPSLDNPLNILIIDELLLLPAQLKQGVSSPLGEILAVGRKAGYIVIGCTQLGQIDTIGRIRDLFPQRICFAVRTDDMADAILGTHATRDGAEAHLLSRPGEGYVFAEDSNNHEKYFERFRSELITDTRSIAQPDGYVKLPDHDELPTAEATDEPPTQPTLKNRRTAVYELRAHDGTPMYVGMTSRPQKRFKEHATTQGWFSQVDLSKTIINWYPNREEATQHEAQRIRELRPIYNILHNFGEDQS